jgi:hypothetical protein
MIFVQCSTFLSSIFIDLSNIDLIIGFGISLLDILYVFKTCVFIVIFCI